MYMLRLYWRYESMVAQGNRKKVNETGKERSKYKVVFTNCCESDCVPQKDMLKS